MYFKRGLLVLLVLTLFSLVGVIADETSPSDLLVDEAPQCLVVTPDSSDVVLMEVVKNTRRLVPHFGLENSLIMVDTSSTFTEEQKLFIKAELQKPVECIDPYSLFDKNDCWIKEKLCVDADDCWDDDDPLCAEYGNCVKFEDMGWDEEVLENVQTIKRTVYEISRSNAIKALKEINSPDFIFIFRKVIEDSFDENSVEEALFALKELETLEAIQVIMKVAETHSSSRVRTTALEILGDLESLESVPTLKRIVENDQSVPIRILALEVLTKLNPPELTEILKKLTEGNAPFDVRIEAHFDFVKIAPDEFYESSKILIQDLIEVLENNPFDQRRSEAAAHLGRIGALSAVPELIKEFENEENPTTLRINLLAALIKLGSPEAILAAKKGFSDDIPSVRFTAIDKFGKELGKNQDEELINNFIFASTFDSDLENRIAASAQLFYYLDAERLREIKSLELFMEDIINGYISSPNKLLERSLTTNLEKLSEAEYNLMTNLLVERLGNEDYTQREKRILAKLIEIRINEFFGFYDEIFRKNAHLILKLEEVANDGNLIYVGPLLAISAEQIYHGGLDVDLVDNPPIINEELLEKIDRLDKVYFGGVEQSLSFDDKRDLPFLSEIFFEAFSIINWENNDFGIENVYSTALSAYRYNLENPEKTVEESVDFILEEQVDFRDEVIIGDDTKLIVLTNSELREVKLKGTLRTWMTYRFNYFEIVNFSKSLVNNPEELLMENEDNLIGDDHLPKALELLEESSGSQTVFWFAGHGDLSEGEYVVSIGSGSSTTNEYVVSTGSKKIRTSELCEVLKSRGNIEEVTLIISACFSYNFIDKLNDCLLSGDDKLSSTPLEIQDQNFHNP